jgi:hypothetical protein
MGVTLTADSNDISTHSSSFIIPIWALVYYALASGDIIGAADELNKCVSIDMRHIESAPVYVIQCLAKLQQQNSSVSSSNDVSNISQLDFAKLDQCRRECLTLYKNELKESDDTHDVYRAFILNILSDAPDTDSCIDPGLVGYNLENYLWANLWLITNNRMLVAAKHASGMNAAIAIELCNK